MDTNPDNHLARLIRRAFANSGLSIKALAKRADVSYGALHGFIAGTRDCTLGTASKLCKALGLKLVSSRRKVR